MRQQEILTAVIPSFSSTLRLEACTSEPKNKNGKIITGSHWSDADGGDGRSTESDDRERGDGGQRRVAILSIPWGQNKSWCPMILKCISSKCWNISTRYRLLTWHGTLWMEWNTVRTFIDRIAWRWVDSTPLVRPSEEWVEDKLRDSRNVPCDCSDWPKSGEVDETN